jgi:HEAT repeat protein
VNSPDPDIVRLRRALHSANRHERAQAAVELGNQGDRVSLDELRGMANDPDGIIAVSAIFGCWQLGDTTLPVDRAAASLASADEEEVQLAVQALCAMGAAVVPGLMKLLDAGSPHALFIVRILGDIGGPESRKAVERITRSGDPSLADAARAVLADWSDD